MKKLIDIVYVVLFLFILTLFSVWFVWSLESVLEAVQEAPESVSSPIPMGSYRMAIQTPHTFSDSPSGIYYTEEEFYSRPANKNGEVEQEIVIPNQDIKILPLIPQKNMLNQPLTTSRQVDEIVQYYEEETRQYYFPSYFNSSTFDPLKSCIDEEEGECKEWVSVDTPSSVWLLIPGLIALIWRRRIS